VRRALLTDTLGFRAIEWRYRPDPAAPLEKYLDSWRGLGDVIARAGLRRGTPPARRSLARDFYATGMAHSVVYGNRLEPTPWRAVNRAAWRAISDPRMAA